MSINSITLSDEEGQGERAPNRRISSLFLGVFAVAAAGVCVHFPTWWTHYLNSVSAAWPRASPLVAAIFRTKWLQRERCSVTCQRRRRPGQARHRQGRLQITAAMSVRRAFADVVLGDAELGNLRAPRGALLPDASSKPSATTSSSSGRTPPDPRASDKPHSRHRTPRAAVAAGSPRHAPNCGHASGLRWLFLGQTARERALTCVVTGGVASLGSLQAGLCTHTFGRRP
jgi:hypothetical protein